MMNLHFIAIGGAAMHNLALALHLKGIHVTGSDDEINEPSASRLKKHGLFPAEMGWNPDRISDKLDGVILGMHAREDNPELIKAQSLGIPVFSYPAYIFEQSKSKKRFVIGGSHGKTTVTAMVMHVLKDQGLDFDYMVGSNLEGFETMVKLTDSAPIIILEGDEYLASPIDRRPKFHLYFPHVALLTGIAWDHINVFPTFENYKDQFKIFIELIGSQGHLFWAGTDSVLEEVVKNSKGPVNQKPYFLPDHIIRNGVTEISPSKGQPVGLKIFGDHNLMNLEGARLLCEQAGVAEQAFYKSISTFKGAARRLELVFQNEASSFYKDFAHSPSKLKATTEAVKKQFPERKLVACMELHTFSSLNEHFLDEYNGSMALADEAIIYFNPKTIEHKKLKEITPERVMKAFGGDNCKVVTSSKEVVDSLTSMNWDNRNLVMMSSGNFGGIDFQELSTSLFPTLSSKTHGQSAL